MITKDVKSYLETIYGDYRKTVSELSKNDSGKVLVADERKLYDFDAITEAIYGTKIPQSADSIFASEKIIFLAEYKSGFKKKISVKKFDINKMTCPDEDTKICQPYAKLFLKNQKNEDKILSNSIHLKAVESYMTVTREMIPFCKEDKTDKIMVYYVVVDDYVESMEDILNGLAGKSSEDNVIESMRQSLQRFRKNERKDYYYDEIEVLTPYDFKKILDKFIE